MNLDGKVTNPGELRTRITLQTRTMVTDAGGYQVPSWATIATVWAKWMNVHGAEAREAGAAGAEESATVLIRYRSELDRTCAVLKGTKQYEIVSIDNMRERSEYMELQVRRVGAG